MQYTAPRQSQSPQSSNDFRYRPLNRAEGEDIRLLCLYPGEFHDSIRCDLLHTSLDFGIGYEALSYTWALEDGDASLSHRIMCAYLGDEATGDLPVTSNCASALRRLRSTSEERVLWIDAIAIEQANQQERNHQVELMAKIYSGASQVLIYLGEEDLGFGFRGLWLDSEKRYAALRKLFAKRWVSRVWVIQEVALARRLVMITGGVSCHMDANLLSRIRGRARAHGLQVPGPLAWDPLVSAPTRDLLTMLDISRNCLSTDPRDKVYGLLGLVGERLQSLITIDYSQSVAEVLTRTAAAIIITRRDFEILTHASSSLGSSHAEKGLPTWVPNWLCDYSMPRPQFQRARIGPWRSLNELTGSLSRNSEFAKKEWNSVVSLPKEWIIHTISKPFITVRAHCIGTIDSTTRQDDGKTQRWQDCLDFSQGLSTLLDGVLDSSEIDPRALPVQYKWLFDRSYSRSDFAQDGLDVSALNDGRTMKFDFVDIQRFCTELVNLGQEKFIFRAGPLPAVASHDFNEGDTVWAIDGCTVPLILRSTSNVTPGNMGVPGYKIVGNCYLLTLLHLDCWATSGTGLEQRWDFDPFRYMDAHGTQNINIY
jgi:hypothetical protein